MEKITIEMPLVSSCTVNDCAYNVSNSCHAKAITIGDGVNPGCDTFFEFSAHNKETKRIAGVGACKVSTCKHNNDYECNAKTIKVGHISNRNINCLTFSS